MSKKLTLPCAARCCVHQTGVTLDGYTAKCTLHQIHKVWDKERGDEQLVGLIEWPNGELCVKYIGCLQIVRAAGWDV